MFLPFIDRVEELGSLEKAHSGKGFSFIVIYGRRRVGKTSLLKRFLSDKEGLYFLCFNSFRWMGLDLYLKNQLFSM